MQALSFLIMPYAKLLTQAGASEAPRISLIPRPFLSGKVTDDHVLGPP